MLRLISFDFDGTLEVGDPPGAITIDMVRRAKANGWLVGSCSDRGTSAQKVLWDRAELEVDFMVMKPQLDLVRAKYPSAENYLHIGDTDVDRWYAEKAGFDFLHIEEAHLVDWLRELGPFREL